jgi:hypothetical protein
MEHNPKRTDTTLGELIAAASEVAFEYSDNDRDAYQLARLALIELIKNSSHTMNFNKEFEFPTDSKETVH